MLALIRVARMAKDMYAVGEERKYLHTTRWDEIKEALKEIEC
jgi:ribosomal protein L19E